MLSTEETTELDHRILNVIAKLELAISKFNDNVDKIFNELDNPESEQQIRPSNSEQTSAHLVANMKQSECYISHIIDPIEATCNIVYANWYSITYVYIDALTSTI